MTPRVIPWWQPYVGEAERRRVETVLASGYINEGDVTAEFESAVAQLVGVKYAVATTSGTSALFLALSALGIGPGDEVLVPDVTFIATANAVRMTGARPVLVDVLPDGLTISVSDAHRAMTSRTRAAVPVHLSGRCADSLASLGVPVVEDACQAFTSCDLSGRALGTIGAAGCFSFSPNKLITTGQGGMVVTNDSRLAWGMRTLKNQGHPPEVPREMDDQLCFGFNLKFTDIQAAIGLAQLERLPGRVDRLRRTHTMYRVRLADRQDIALPAFCDSELPLWTPARSSKACGVPGGCRPMYHPLHTKPMFADTQGLFPGAMKALESFWLPSAFTMTDADVEQTCQKVIASLELESA